MNQVQVLGSHNSYKQPIEPALMKLLLARDAARFEELDYSHLPLARQLDLGLRKLEIDVVHDPEGGRYAAPRGLAILKERGLTAEPYDAAGEMKRPGLKVLHVPDLDFRSHNATFIGALRELKRWSDAHPRHLPIVITMNAKDEGIAETDYVQPLPFDRAAFDAWDAEIRQVLPPARLITPDDVRGSHATLEEAVLAHDWPTLGRARGRFLFVLDETGAKQQTYLDGHPSLRGRVMFVNAREGRPEAAFRIVNDPVKDFRYIQHLVRSGYLVRTRADAETKEARRNDYARMDAAWASGAQYVSTDYYQPDPRFGTGFVVKLPGGKPGRWNPLLLPPERPLPPLE